MRSSFHPSPGSNHGAPARAIPLSGPSPGPRILNVPSQIGSCQPLCALPGRPSSFLHSNDSPDTPHSSSQPQNSYNNTPPQSLQNRRTSLGPKLQLSPLGNGICKPCSGSGNIVCPNCSGTGFLSRGGYNKKNPVPREVINSKWTAMQETIGWRHFRVIQQRKSAATAAGGGGAGGSKSGPVFLLMQASCDPSAQIWVNKDALRDRNRWAAGWLQRSEMQLSTQGVVSDGNPGDDEEGPRDDLGRSDEGREQGQGVPAPVKGGPVQPTAPQGSKPCKACGGTGKALCRACDASGVVLIDL